MTAAFATLDHDQINDASPQLNVIQRIGGSLGTAVVAVILQSKLTHLPHTATVASAFAGTYWWVVGLSILGLAPVIVLWRVERQARAEGRQSHIPEDALIEVAA